MKRDHILQKIDSASHVIGKTWPLYAFVTSNPLTGYENRHFKQAISEVEQLVGGQLLPQVSTFINAWEQEEIDRLEIDALFKKNGIGLSPEESLAQMQTSSPEFKNPSHEVDRLVIKWLMAFMDEGLAEWSMPNKEKGFYKAWKTLAKYDQELNLKSSVAFPDESVELISDLVSDFSEADQIKIFEYHLSALPGWTGYIKNRAETNSEWQKKFKISLEDYLAVRLWMTKHLNFEIRPGKAIENGESKERNLQYLWLKAWEKSWQNKLSKELDQILKISEATRPSVSASETPDAQLVFCIDTRSELIRRHVESKGNYETFGYAGFFGIAMDYENLSDGIIKKSCPPIVASSYKVSEEPKKEKHLEAAQYHKRQEKEKFTHYFLKRMKHMLPSAFGYVEGSGFFYGISLFLRTVLPEKLYNPRQVEKRSFERYFSPHIHSVSDTSSSDQISLEEKTAIVKSAFDLMGWKNFSPLVLFVGHGSHSANNPFGSSLDCGACAASPGRHNARMLAKLANLPEVKRALKEHDILIPDSTFFMGAEHNTTTDEILIFDSELPETHKAQLANLKANLHQAQGSATTERLGKSEDSIKAAHIKTNDWSETRPEWGLAKNAGFIVGPRSLSKSINLQGNCFLHSYDWEMDSEGKALEGIMQGPMVVTQWINNHYYFSSVDNDNYGGGSKITHNVTGRFGVMQGNGGDLKRGLPLQSVNETDQKAYHQPLRLSVYIHAPLERINGILQKNANLKSLLDNEWIYLLVIDPGDSNTIKRYEQNFTWKATEKGVEKKLVGMQ
ncbi:DUF2309 domain-containing protein [Psychroflexus sediminis]|uniref:Probable inorganic carbon transporter subunit DabA n=1 Tax=Psychroflexus sediminis TaxID=470826 RepID=A0A1G7VX92_9FLAO|nr:DUF2309 domain-containing protein [Psychroflexus sediminis]SDG64353.1 hypothetical protein SAMN04488027_104232 [Psychroflexus sediminis]